MLCGMDFSLLERKGGHNVLFESDSALAVAICLGIKDWTGIQQAFTWRVKGLLNNETLHYSLKFISRSTNKPMAWISNLAPMIFCIDLMPCIFL